MTTRPSLTSHSEAFHTVVAGAVAAIVVVLHLLCLPSQAITDDDDFYAPAGIRAADWLGEVLTSPTAALSKTGIDAAFAINHEHPPLAKVVFGLSHWLWHDVVGVLGSLDGARAGTVLLVGLLAWWMVRWLWRPMGPLPALASVAVLISLPRFFLHSEVATLDVPVAVMIFVVTALFERARDRTAAGVIVGVVFGLALATKLNAPFALLPCALLVLLERWRGFGLQRASSTTPSASLLLPPLPTSLLAMLLVGPLVFVAVWPWLWPDPVARLGGYVAFHLKHYPIFLFFDGEIWERPFAPGRASLVMAAGTVPVMVVATAAVGATTALKALWRIVVGASADGMSAPSRDRILALSLLQAVMALGLVATADVPRYGGEKLFMPFFPFLAVLSAVGLAGLASSLQRLMPRLPRAVVVVVVVSAVVAPGLKGIVDTFGGFGLSYYGELVGGLRGAVARGHERTYYDLADKELARTLDVVAAGERVHVEPNHKEYLRTWRWLRKDGVLRRDGFVIEGQLERADVVVLTHERRWLGYPALRERLRGWPVIAEHRVDGVPLWTISRRPR